jgi:GxxExxY protein
MEAVDSITDVIISSAIEIHREIGPGLLESTYEACLAELILGRGLKAERQVPLSVTFRGKRLDRAYRLDLVVERRVVVELKTVVKFDLIHFAQMNTYLKHSGCDVGLLINFDVARLTDGIRRVGQPYRGPLRS